MSISFLHLPAELRSRVYTYIFAPLVVHICSSRRGCGGSNFDADCLSCCESDYMSFCRPGQWEAGACDVRNTFPTALFLSCRAVYREAENSFWAQATFAVGLPQFNAFYPRLKRVRNLRLVVPDPRRLAGRMGHDYNFCHLSPYLCVLDAWEAGARTVAEGLRLRRVEALVSGSLGFSPPVLDEDLPLSAQILSADVINALFYLRRAKLEGFAIEYAGAVEVDYYEGSMVGAPVRVELSRLPWDSGLARRLRSLARGLRDMVLDGEGEGVKLSPEVIDVYMAELEERVQKYMLES